MYGNYGNYYSQYQGYGMAQPQQYQTMQQPIQPTVTQPPQQQTGGMIWVQGEAGAKAYLVAPGTTVTLWDSEDQTIYLKSCDNSGMPSLKILDWQERDTTQPKQNPQLIGGEGEYVKRDEFEELKARIEKLSQILTKSATKEEKKNG